MPKVWTLEGNSYPAIQVLGDKMLEIGETVEVIEKSYADLLERENNKLLDKCLFYRQKIEDQEEG